MIFRTTAFLAASFLAPVVLSNSVTANSNKKKKKPKRPTKSSCPHYTLNLELGPWECTPKKIQHSLEDFFSLLNLDCIAKKELLYMTGTTSKADSHTVLNALCARALNDAVGDAEIQDWSALEDAGSIDVEDYYAGNGFVNLETGNFRQNPNDFIEVGGHDRFISISGDPRTNDHYPTTKQSYNAGKKIKEFYKDVAKRKFLSAPPGFSEERCASNTVMCCWGRDRQYLDDNGSCAPASCAHGMPGDNTDLCWTRDERGVPIRYPSDDIEGDLHCHGISWKDDSVNDGDFQGDIHARAKWNALFYTSMYDHTYKRGYVESITNDPNIVGSQPMCGCIEDMNPVARADCTEAFGKTNYTVSRNPDNGQIIIDRIPDTFELGFRACEGYTYPEGASVRPSIDAHYSYPTDTSVRPASDVEYSYPPDTNPHLDVVRPASDVEYSYPPSTFTKLPPSNNDLAGFVFRQYLEGKIGDDHVTAVEKTLVGYQHPEVNENDENRDRVCSIAFLEFISSHYPKPEPRPDPRPNPKPVTNNNPLVEPRHPSEDIDV